MTTEIGDEPRAHVERLLTDYLELDASVDWTQVRYQEHERWDSLVQMAIVADLEETYGLVLDDEDIVAMEDLEAILQVLRARGAGT